MALSLFLARLRRRKPQTGADQPHESFAGVPTGLGTRAARVLPRKFPVGPLFLGVLLTMALGAFGTWNAWITYRGFQDIDGVELPLDRLSGVIVHLDEVLTMSARMCAVTGEEQWEDRYRYFEPKLDSAIKETIALSPDESVRQAAMRIDFANVRLVEMEHASFDLVKAGHPDEAQRLLLSREYEEQKGIYAEAIGQCKRAVELRVDDQLRRHSRRSLIGLALTLAALVALGVGWARVVRLLRQSFADRLVLQARLEDAVRARDEFLSVASHELKTPLTTLKLQVQSLGVSLKRDAELQGRPNLERKLAMTDRQVVRLSNLIDELLDTSRITSGRMILTLEDDVDLSEVIAEAVGRFKNELMRAGCDIQVRGIAVPILGRWDRLRLDQVLSNLIANALKYGAGRPVEIVAEASEGVASFTVRDHGIGISPEKQDVIFRRFERAVPEREYGGFGLGLWIVREIASAMGGNVSVTSQLGQGTTFRVVLPRAPDDGENHLATGVPRR